jgi:hypothetical protein
MAHQLSHSEIPQKPSSNLGELDYATGVHLEAESATRTISFLNSPQKAAALQKTLTANEKRIRIIALQIMEAEKKRFLEIVILYNAKFGTHHFAELWEASP